MKIRSLAATACILALSACNSNSGENSAANSAGGSGNSAATGSAAAGGNSARPVDPQLTQELSMAVQVLRPQLPLKQQTPQGEVRVTNIEARGGELVYTMEVPTDLDQAKVENFKTQACANAQMKQLMERGATYTYQIKDSGGEEFNTTVSSC